MVIVDGSTVMDPVDLDVGEALVLLEEGVEGEAVVMGRVEMVMEEIGDWGETKPTRCVVLYRPAPGKRGQDYV